MSKYKITINNPGGRFCNPLLGLRGEEYDTREEACEAIYCALYDVIDSAEGFEMVDPPDWNSFGEDDDEAYCHAKDEYIKSCHDYILRDGWATEDGVSASVEEIVTARVKTCDMNGCHPDHVPCLLAQVVLDGRKYMAMQTRQHETMRGTWEKPLVARIPMDWTMSRLLSSGDGVCNQVWELVANGHGDGCEIVVDEDEINAVVTAIEDCETASVEEIDE